MLDHVCPRIYTCVCMCVSGQMRRTTGRRRVKIALGCQLRVKEKPARGVLLHFFPSIPKRLLWRPPSPPLHCSAVFGPRTGTSAGLIRAATPNISRQPVQLCGCCTVCESFGYLMTDIEQQVCWHDKWLKICDTGIPWCTDQYGSYVECTLYLGHFGICFMGPKTTWA